MGSSTVDLHILDTHVWIWLVNGGPERIHPRALDAIRTASATASLALSAISLWEVAMLESKGRLQLHADAEVWLTEALRRTRIQLLPLSAPIAVASTRLPGELHGDPADRIITATARQTKAVLITRDRALLDYAARGYVLALEA